MLAIGSAIASPSHPGRLDIVTGVQVVGDGPGGKIAVVRSQSIEAGSRRPAQGGSGPVRLAPVNPGRVQPGIADNALVRPDTLIAAQAAEEISGEGSRGGPIGDLGAEEQRAVDRLRQRDSAVRQEEEAHAAAAGQYAGAPRYQFVTGPDGRPYVVSGHVSIKATSTSGRPEDAKRALSTVANAALAAHAPSAQDLSVARASARDAGSIAQAEKTSQSRAPDARQLERGLAAYQALLDPTSSQTSSRKSLDITG